MKIGLVCHAYVPHLGGIEIVVQNLARQLSREHQVVVVSTGWEKQQGVSREGAVAIHRLPALHLTEKAGVPYPIPLGRGVRAAWDALERCDVLHTHGSLYPTTIAAAALSRRRGMPLVLTEHVGFVQYRNPALNLAQRLAWKLIGDRVVGRAAAVVSVGDRVRAWLQRRYPQRTPKLVQNGVEMERFRPLGAGERTAAREALALPGDRPLALFVGRHMARKNLPAVLAIPRLGFDLVLCGERSAVRGEHLIDLGFLRHEDMPRLYGCVDLLVHAAVDEGFPLAVQEAMACGLPVALLWDPGYGAALEPDAVAASDSLSQLAGTVAALVRDPEERARLGRRARAHAERHWSWAAAAGAYLDLYREAMAART